MNTEYDGVDLDRIEPLDPDGEWPDKSYQWKLLHLRYIPREIRRLVEVLGLDESVVKMADQIHESSIERGFTNRDADDLAAACVYTAVRLAGKGVALQKVASASRAERNHIYTVYRGLNEELSLRVGPREPGPHLEEVMDDLAFPAGARGRAKELLAAAEGAGLADSVAPKSLAAAVAYTVGQLSDDPAVSDFTVTQADVSEAADVGLSTLRKHYKKLVDVLELDLRTQQGRGAGGDRRPRPSTVEATRARLDEAFNLTPVQWAALDRILEVWSVDEVVGSTSRERSPASVLAGAFWVAVSDVVGGADVRQADVGYEVGVSKTTVQKSASDWRKWIDAAGVSVDDLRADVAARADG